MTRSPVVRTPSPRPSARASTAAPILPRLAATAIVALALLAWGLAGPAAAEDTSCTAPIAAETHDNIVVPDGATCVLDGTTVQGNVIVGTGSTLQATGVDVDGNIQAEGAAEVVVTDSEVGGSVQLVQGGAATILTNLIDSDLQLESNDGALRSDGNTIGGNLQANQNSGGLAIDDNTIDGNLQCQANDPAPTGGGNVVAGSAEDQCESLTGTGTPSPTPSPTPTDPAPTPTEPGTKVRTSSRLAGPDRFSTAVAITQRAYPGSAAVVYLARADEFADALAASSLDDGPLLLVPSCGEVPTVVLDEIRRLDPTEVIALGGAGAICEATLQQAAAA